MTRLLLALAVLALVTADVAAQSLADVARAEAERRKKIAAPGKLYTNEDLRPDPFGGGRPAEPAVAANAADATPAALAPSALAPAEAAAPAADPRRDEAYWRTRITEARQQLERSRLFADALQSRINALTTDFVNRDDPAQRDVIAADRARALAELERVKREIEEQTKAIADIEEEARRAGVPPGWLRP